MSRGLGGGSELLIFGLALGVVVGGCAGYQVGHDGDPKDGADHKCEVAWVDANDGDPSTSPAGIIDEPWCQQHNTTMTTIRPEVATP